VAIQTRRWSLIASRPSGARNDQTSLPHPIVLSGAQRRALLCGGVDVGCRNLIERYPEAVARIEAANPHYVPDVDTPEAYAAWIDR
jgi:CTP:molybdopterin cytidylyltransferase MocA